MGERIDCEGVDVFCADCVVELVLYRLGACNDVVRGGSVARSTDLPFGLNCGEGGGEDIAFEGDLVGDFTSLAPFWAST